MSRTLFMIGGLALSIVSGVLNVIPCLGQILSVVIGLIAEAAADRAPERGALPVKGSVRKARGCPRQGCCCATGGLGDAGV